VLERVTNVEARDLVHVHVQRYLWKSELISDIARGYTW
jgi:hypothetical protein